MPLAKPKKNESKEDFLERCMSDDVMAEYKKKQRFAICNALWNKEKDMKTNFEERGAIGRHKTALSDKAWDGPKNKRNLKKDAGPDYYKKAHAWIDPEGNPETKAAYKFIHHEVSSDGTIGAANIRACQATIAVLNGARGGTQIPDADKKGVWNHVAGHLKDGDLEPAELKSRRVKIEERSYLAEVRISEDEKKLKIAGYASIFNELSEDLGGFREKVDIGAFRKTIKNSDIKALINHDVNKILGRNISKTLILEEDDKGLKMEIYPPNTTYANNLLESMRRSDIDQCSFQFHVPPGGDKWDDTNKNKIIRTLKEVELFDVSVVTFPAYLKTSADIRSAGDVYKDYLSESQERKLRQQAEEAKWQEQISFKRKRLELIEKM